MKQKLFQVRVEEWFDVKASNPLEAVRVTRELLQENKHSHVGRIGHEVVEVDAMSKEFGKYVKVLGAESIRMLNL